mmetsp:Transcript_4194/g.4595  ORF Transcript_4194/g.4595 Transcript_4194/m.4595 type:complete len:116 (+) Transcript_4194:364-711(+)
MVTTITERMDTVQALACKDIPSLECESTTTNPLLKDAAALYQRSIPEKLFCKHIPSSCSNNKFFEADTASVNDYWLNNNNQHQFGTDSNTNQKKRKKIRKLAADADWYKYFDLEQ